MGKVFPHTPPRVYSASKALKPPDPPLTEQHADLAAQRETLEAAERDKHARAAQRAAMRAEVRDRMRKEAERNVAGIRSVNDHLFRFFSVDVLMVNSLIGSLDGKMPKAKVMRKLSPIITPWITEPQQRCVLCAEPFAPQSDLSRGAYPCIIISSRPKPPHKRPPAEPVCICNNCFSDKRGVDNIEAILFAYTKMVEPDLSLGLSDSDIAVNLARCKLYALRRARRADNIEADLEESP